jgi:hypothetical protein
MQKHNESKEKIQDKKKVMHCSYSKKKDFRYGSEINEKDKKSCIAKIRLSRP